METCTREIELGEAERRGSKGRSREKERRKRKEEETEKRENDGNKKSSGRIGDMRQRRRGSEVGGRSQEAGTREIS